MEVAAQLRGGERYPPCGSVDGRWWAEAANSTSNGSSDGEPADRYEGVGAGAPAAPKERATVGPGAATAAALRALRRLARSALLAALGSARAAPGAAA